MPIDLILWRWRLMWLCNNLSLWLLPCSCVISCISFAPNWKIPDWGGDASGSCSLGRGHNSLQSTPKDDLSDLGINWGNSRVHLNECNLKKNTTLRVSSTEYMWVWFWVDLFRSAVLPTYPLDIVSKKQQHTFGLDLIKWQDSNCLTSSAYHTRAKQEPDLQCCCCFVVK